MAVRRIEDFTDAELASLIQAAQSGLWRDADGNARVGSPDMLHIALYHLLKRSSIKSSGNLSPASLTFN
jgi:hypothetical protein